jgi:hypothetical protein
LLTLASPLWAQDAPIDRARAWLAQTQNDNGGWPDGFSGERSGAGVTAEILLGLTTLEATPQTLRANPLAYLENFANNNAQTLTLGLATRFLWVALALRQDVRDFGGVNLPLFLSARQAEDGRYSPNMLEHCHAVNALAAAGFISPMDEAVRLIVSAQSPSGGWSAFEGQAPDTHSTTACLVALAVSGVRADSAAIKNGLDYLRQTQNPDGGWSFQSPNLYGLGSDAYSTAWALMALNALGQDPADWGDPARVLLTFQDEEGAFRLYPEQADASRFFVVGAALSALRGGWFGG